jgi:hypothetical protein
MRGQLGSETAWTALLCAAVLTTAPAATFAAGIHVLPAGEEALMAALFAPPPLADGCALLDVQIAARAVRATYQCGNSRPTLTLRHAAESPEAKAASDCCDLAASRDAPAALVTAITAQIQSRGKDLRWQSLDQAATQPPPAADVRSPLTAQQWTLLQAARAACDAGKSGDALDAAVRLAAETTATVVVDLLVTAAATGGADDAHLRALRQDADGAPNVAAKQFAAGVVAFFHGQDVAATAAQKRGEYQAAAAYLQRARASLAQEPRVFLLRAAALARAGEGAAAEASLQEAQFVGPQAAELPFYRAEIHQHAQRQAAVADLRQYLAVLEQSAVPPPGSLNARMHARASTALHRLEAPAVAEDATIDVFDPLAATSAGPRSGWAATATALALLAASVAWAIWRYRRRATSEAL